MSQPNIFIVYMPPGNAEAMVHYEDTIKNRVALDRIYPHLTREQADTVRKLFGQSPVAVWGSRDTDANRSKFVRMKSGDSLLIVEGAMIKFMGKIALTTISQPLSRELWRNLRGASTSGWDLIYVIANPLEVGVPFREFCRLFGYQENYQLRGFTAVSQDKLDEFGVRYDDLYSILMRIRDGLPVETKPAQPMPAPPPPPASEPVVEAPSPVASKHVEMQCKLAKLGAKGGQGVWIPLADRTRLKSAACDFDRFEERFTVGIDTPARYVENIDVVWKEQFRIDAAYEVENSTGIYSGLLRFADLSVIAPNSPYPMFIVAPAARLEEVRRQLRRPAFEVLKLPGRVMFLPYEEVDEIERFYRRGAAGPTAEVMKGRAMKAD